MRTLLLRAEEQFNLNGTAHLETLSPVETKRLLHELQVHQIELEMQNEELLRTQSELEVSRTRYFDLYDLAPVGYLTINKQGLILEANLTAATLLGVAKGALVNKQFSRLILEECQDIYNQHRTLLFETGEPQSCELRMLKKDGTAFGVQLSTTTSQDSFTNTLKDADGEHVFRVVLIDITARKRADEMLKKLNEVLEYRVLERTAEIREKDQILLSQSRQAAMGEMISNIAHQWRQPLNTLGLTIQELLLFYDLDEFNREFLEKSVNKSMELIQHMSGTIDDFRNYFRPDKEKVKFNVREAISNTLSLIEDSFKNQHITLEVIARNEPIIHGYRNEFAQALLNILNNARDVLTERSTDNPRVTVTIHCEGNRAVVTISDNAGGIPEEIMGKIFDPYFTTKGPQAGTGVGLFMSKAIIEKNMGGYLTARNIADGAEFRIEV